MRDPWDSHWLTNMGIKHKQLAELSDIWEFQILLFCKRASCIECVIAAFNLSRGYNNSFYLASTTHAIVRNGLEPVFCDIDSDDYTIDTDKLESDNGKTFTIPVHVYGNICNINEIEKIAKKYNLKVIYDAAHAFGVTVDGGVNNSCDVSMFSFHATKVFHTIEGGAVTHKDGVYPRSSMTLRILHHRPESVEYVGGNAKMNEFQAAMGTVICVMLMMRSQSEKLLLKDILMIAKY